MRLNYVANWDDNYKNTWSGTTYALLTSLEENNNISSVNMNDNIVKLLSKVNLKIIRYMGIDIFYPYLQRRLKNIALKQTPNKSVNVQVHSIVNLPNSYVYEDLIWEALAYIKKMILIHLQLAVFKDLTIKCLVII